MANFEEILEGIHSGSLLSDDADKAIVVNSRRIFEIPEGFDTVIGYAGDVNSQIITFQLPLTHDNHDLSECHNQKLKWKHLNSGAEGWSELTKTTVDKTQNCWTATWAVPLDLMAQAGNIEIGISLYDFNNEHITFSWNTSTYNGFSIGEAFSEVGSLVYDQTIPAKNEILNIVTDTRQIIAPIGYNKTIANYGDVGITKVYFYADQVIDGINLSQGKIYINIQRPDLNCRDYENIDTAVIEVGSEKVLLTWNVPEYITNGVDSNNDPISGNFTISITFESSDGSKKWTSASFNGLTIGDSLLSTEIGEGGTRLDWQEMIDQAVEKTIANDIESTLDTRYVQQNDSKGARRFYSIDRNGQQTIAVGADVDQACHSGNVAMYMNDNNGKNEPRAALVSKTPVNDYQVANKKYVDDRIASIARYNVTIHLTDPYGRQLAVSGNEPGNIDNYKFLSTSDWSDEPEIFTIEYVNKLYLWVYNAPGTSLTVSMNGDLLISDSSYNGNGSFENVLDNVLTITEDCDLYVTIDY